MRLFAHRIRRGHVRSGLIAILLAMNGTLVSLGQVADSMQPTSKQPDETLTVGTEVVFGCSGGSITNRERLARIAFPPPYFIDRIDGDRVLISSRHKKKQQRVTRAEVVPFKKVMDDLSGQITGGARALAQRAQLWADHGDDERARADLDLAIHAQPDEPWLYVRRSTVLLRQQKLDQAFDDCNKAIELAPNDVLAYFNRAKVWEARNDLKHAGADLDQAVRLDPTNPAAWGERARVWLYERNPNRALDDIDEAIRLAPDDAGLRYWRGRCWAGKGDEDKAVADYTEAIRLDPEDMPSFEGRLRAYLEKGELDRVIADATEAIKLDPQRVGFYLLRGNAWYKKQEYDKAIDDDASAIKLDPTNAFAYACRAQAWGRNHDRDKQTADYTTAIELDPHNAVYRLFRASTWAMRGKHARAMEDYDEAVRLDPSNPEVYVYRGIEQQKDLSERVVGKYSRALADFDRATELDPAYANAYLQRGRIWTGRREFGKAVREFETLIERNSNHPLGHQALAWALSSSDDARIRDGRRAVSEATRACDLTRWNDENCLDTLAAAYAETGDFPAAVKWVDRAIEVLRKSPVADNDLLQVFEVRRALYLSHQPCRE